MVAHKETVPNVPKASVHFLLLGFIDSEVIFENFQNQKET